MFNWVKKIYRWFLLSIFSVEINSKKQILTNESGSVGDDTNLTLRQENVFQEMINGELTEEVKKVRWRMYKTLEGVEKLDNKRNKLKNPNIKVSKKISHNSKKLLFDMVSNVVTDSGSITHDKLNDDYIDLEVGRNVTPPFKIEKFIKKFFILKDGKTITIYLNFNNKVTTDRLNETKIKQSIERKRFNEDFLDISDIKFMGQNMMLSTYDILKCIKVEKVKYDYILTYSIELKESESLVECFTNEELDNDYNNKKKRVENNKAVFDNIQTFVHGD